MDIKSPIIWSTTSTSLEELASGIKNVISEGCQSILLLTCVENDYDEQQTNQMITKCPVPICGGMFPQIILHENNLVHGAIVIGFMFESAIANYTMLSTSNADLESYVEDNSSHLENYQNFIIIGDALCSANEDFIDIFYDYIGSGISVIGGGVGSLDFIPRSCIYTNQGLINDAMQVIAIPYPIKCSLGHGSKLVSGPYLVTAAENHIILSLNHMPAFELYRDEIMNSSGQIINKDNFFDIAKNYPLGIMGTGDELLVRDPIKSDESSLECLGNVPTNSMVYLLKTEQERMIQSAGKAAQDIGQTNKSTTLFLFDCISRGLFMGDDFNLELKAISKHAPDANLLGVMSLSEFTTIKSGAIRLLNKSTVIGSM